MHDERAVTWASEADRKRDMRRRRIAEAKHRAYMFGHKIFWRTLYALHLAGAYSRFMCHRGWYRKFPDGRCMWCGLIGKYHAEQTTDSNK